VRYIVVEDFTHGARPIYERLAEKGRTANWSDLMTCEIFPVLDSAEAASRATGG